MNMLSKIEPAYEHTKAGNILFNLCARWTEYVVNHRKLYYILACTWGAIMTLAGFIVSGVLRIANIFVKNLVEFRPYHWIYAVAVGKNWGGLEFGLCFLRESGTNERLNAHEFGHTFQNALFGPFFIFLVWIPSICWYWSKSSEPYDSRWWEDAATQCGLYASKFLSNKEISEE
jgi:hypothetical protein